jgi:hypothetical protein
MTPCCFGMTVDDLELCPRLTWLISTSRSRSSSVEEASWTGASLPPRYRLQRRHSPNLGHCRWTVWPEIVPPCRSLSASGQKFTGLVAHLVAAPTSCPHAAHPYRHLRVVLAKIHVGLHRLTVPCNEQALPCHSSRAPASQPTTCIYTPIYTYTPMSYLYTYGGYGSP